MWTNIFYTQNASSFWGEDVAKFRPARHLNVQVPNPAWGPFGGGTRRCPGERLGQFDVRYFLAALVKNFEFEVRDAEKASLVYLGSMQIAKELVVRVKTRRT